MKSGGKYKKVMDDGNEGVLRFSVIIEYFLNRSFKI